jgi:hypothetical protein
MTLETAAMGTLWVIMALVVVVVGGSPLVAIALVVRFNWAAIKASPVRWASQASTLAFTVAALVFGYAKECKVALGPQPRCPDALLGTSDVLWGLYGTQVGVAILLAWAAPRRVLWIPLQLLFVSHGFWVTIGAILMVTGQWL